MKKTVIMLFIAASMLFAAAACSSEETVPTPEASPEASAAPEASADASVNPDSSPETSAVPDANASPEASPAQPVIYQANGFTFVQPLGWEVAVAADGSFITLSNANLANTFITVAKSAGAGDTLSLFVKYDGDKAVDVNQDAKNFLRDSYKEYNNVSVEKCELAEVGGCAALRYAVSAEDAEKKYMIEGVLVDSKKESGGDLLSIALKAEGVMPEDVKGALNGIVESVKFS